MKYQIPAELILWLEQGSEPGTHG